jgi:DNA topoisomerase IA
MMMAQRLCEASYIRIHTDGFRNLSSDAVGACRDYIQKQFGAAYLPEQPNVYASKAAAQSARSDSPIQREHRTDRVGRHGKTMRCACTR